MMQNAIGDISSGKYAMTHCDIAASKPKGTSPDPHVGQPLSNISNAPGLCIKVVTLIVL